MNARNVITRFALALTLAYAGCGGLKLNQVLTVGESDWPMFGRTQARTSIAPEVLSPPLSIAWQYDATGGLGTGSPLVVDSVLIVGNLRGELHAVSTVSGRRLGWVGLGDAIEGAPIIDGGDAIVAVSNSNESLLCLELATGRILWRVDYGDIVASPLLYQRKIFVGNTAGKFYCVNREDGSMEWTFTLPENAKLKGIRSSAAADANTVVFGADDGTLYALDAANGSRYWTYEAGSAIAASPVIADSTVYVGTLGGVFHAVHLGSGAQRWTFSTGTSIYASATIAHQAVLIGTTGGGLFAISRTDGSLKWKTNLGSVINSAAVVAGDVAFVGALNKFLYAVDTKDGAIAWKTEMRGRIKTPPIIAHGLLFVATDNRTITAFRESGQ